MIRRHVRGTGRLAAAFLLLFAFTQPPLVFLLANRLEPRVFGWPFVFAYLLVAYLGMVAILVVAARRADRGSR